MTDGWQKAEQEYQSAKPHVWHWFWRVLALVIALSAIFGVIGFIGGWFSTAVRVVSPQNVTAQWAFAYQYDRDLKAIALQVCAADAALKTTTQGTDAYDQRVTQREAYQQNYYRVQAQYDARLANAFEAKLVRPRDVPAQAPTLTENERQNC